MSNFESYKVTNIGNFHLYNAVNCTNNFDFDSFFENYEEEQLVEFFITPKQVVVVYMGDVPNAYHIEISLKLARWINKNDMTSIIAVEIDGSTGKCKLVTPIARYNPRIVTSNMIKAMELIYNKIRNYNIEDLYMEPLENLYPILTVDDNIQLKKEMIIGIPIEKFILEMDNVYKR